MDKIKFDTIFDYQLKSKIKAGDGLILDEGKYPFFTSSNKLSKSINEFIFDGDSLIFGTGGQASIHFYNSKFAVSTDCLVAQAINKDKVFVKYVYYYLSGNIRLLEEGFKGAGLKHISRNYINKLQIPLPPLKTQQRIAQILDDAAALRDKTAQLLKDYDLLAQSIFLEMFGDPVRNAKGWEIKFINNVSEKIQIGPFGSQLHQADYVDSGYCLVNPTDISQGRINIESSRRIDKNKFESLPNYHLKIGDLIMARRGDLSKIAVIQDKDLFCGTGSLYVRFKDEINPVYSLYIFSQKSAISKLYEKARGITMANLNKTIIKEYEIPVPPINLQIQFAEKITLIEQQKELAKQELKESEDLFNCLLQKAFKGEL